MLSNLVQLLLGNLQSDFASSLLLLGDNHVTNDRVLEDGYL